MTVGRFGLKDAICEVCGLVFRTRNENPRFCGRACTADAQVQHGANRARHRTCDACGTPYVAHKLTSRFCTNVCRVQFGKWSFRVAHITNARTFGVTGE